MVTKKRGRKPKAEKKIREEFDLEEEEQHEAFRSKIKKALVSVVGVLILIGGIYLCVWQWENLWPLLQGLAGPVVIMIALFVLLLAGLE